MAATLWAFLITAIVPLALRLLAGIGVGFITFTGVEFGLNGLEASIDSLMGNVAGNILSILNLMGFQTGVNALITTYATAATLRGLSGGIFSRVVWNKPGA